MSKFKCQNKSKYQISNIKTTILSFVICNLCLFWILGFVICHLSFAQPTNTCMLCHQELDGNLKVNVEEIKNDVHFKRGLSCVDCHGGDSTKEDMAQSMDAAKGFIARPARNDIPNFCARCHANPDFMRAYNPNIPMDQLTKYNTSQHGKLNMQGDGKVAVCTSCHGFHGIRPKTDPLSKTYITNIPKLCSGCHSDKEYMKPYSIATNQMEEYEQSVHGQALLIKGDRAAPACNSCHGSHDAILPRTSSIGNVCAQCHTLQRDLFIKSPHKAAHEKLNLPECEVCHGNHKILPAQDEMVGVESPSLCLNCHDQNSAGYETAGLMRESLEALKTKIDAAKNLAQEANKLGMEVSEAEFEINEARNALTKARSYVHSFSAASVKDITKQGIDTANKAGQQGSGAIKEFHFRRKGYLFSVVIILFIALLIYLKIKELDRRRNLK